jgi:Rrf2 family nitric oxide-sensitive transcriptional repressor
MAKRPDEVNLGAVLRHTEGLDDVLACSSCLVVSACGLPPILSEAVKAFVGVFDKYTVEDLVQRRLELRALLAAA